MANIGPAVFGDEPLTAEQELDLLWKNLFFVERDPSIAANVALRHIRTTIIERFKEEREQRAEPAPTQELQDTYAQLQNARLVIRYLTDALLLAVKDYR